MNDFKLRRTRRYTNKNDIEIEKQEPLIETNLSSNEIELNNTNINKFNIKDFLRKIDKNKIRKVIEETQIDEIDFNNGDQSVYTSSNRPQETDFYQQKLNAWKPLLTPKFVINLFLICSILFIPISIILFFTSNSIYEAKYDYTDCLDYNNKSYTCHKQLLQNISYNCVCRIYFYEDNFQDETLHVYYMLDNYYQNIRQYVRSVDNNQLLNHMTFEDLAIECEPFRYKVEKDKLLRKYEPCGAIANSLFNDTYRIYYINKITNKSIKLNISKANLAWDSDRKYKFSNLTNSVNSIKPPNWSRRVTESHEIIEDLMVWMRTAAFPSFRKLYGRILLEENQKLEYKQDKKSINFYKFLKKFEKNDSLLNNGTSDFKIKFSKYFKPINSSFSIMRLPKGQYFIDIDYRYMVKQFDGKKFIVLANTSWLGGKSYFMAWTYLIVGILCFITAIVLFFLHVYYGNMHYNTAILLVDKKTSLVK
ncbi:unnamed protein product [Brachionus calyciflorus]|uniref:Cell cycle control protein 50A n=1 Tax=Brachionus calyciflorus TaxID=104777 RepID=A0A813MLD0_9BILA|nr:unnamed protein product [Brachionus calyciflorus]